VLHTRVPETLEIELKRLSETLRVPVSNIVRVAIEDVLEAAQTLGEAASDEAGDIADRLARLRQRTERDTGRAHDDEEDAERPARKASRTRGERLLRGVIGFQELKLARATDCARCGREMPPGEQAFLGVRDHKGPRVIVGRECLPAEEAAPEAQPSGDET
jgi:hypothetical protein